MINLSERARLRELKSTFIPVSRVYNDLHTILETRILLIVSSPDEGVTVGNRSIPPTS